MAECIDIAVNRHYSKWLRLSVGMTKDKTRAQDLLQTVLIRIIDRPTEDLQQKACNENFYTYVCRALWLTWYSNSSDYARQYRRYEQSVSGEEINENVQDQTFIGSRIDNEYIDGYIMRMNEHDATLLRLYALPDFSYKDLSKHTGIPILYLRKAIHNALTKLRKNAQLQRAASSQD